MRPNFIVNTDGGSRGNPGPAAIGIIIRDEKGVPKEYKKYIGETTNNEAEYKAMIFALQKIKALYGNKEAKKSSVKLRTDSKLLVEQLTGKCKIKKPNIQTLFIELWNLKVDFKQVDFEYVPREENSEADRLVNMALNRNEKSSNQI